MDKILAFELGKLAFKKSQKRSPCLDVNLISLLEGHKVGDGSLAIMQAWLSGWDSANLN